MKITKEKFVSIIISFFSQKKNYTYYTFNKETGLDAKTLKNWHLQNTKTIRSTSVTKFISDLQDKLSSSFEEFAEFAIEELYNNGIEKEFTRNIFYNNDSNISTIMEILLELDTSVPKYKQEIIGTANIIETLKSFLSIYREYFQVIEPKIGEKDADTAYYPLVYCNSQSENSIPSLNYLILKFPNTYHVGIILSNHIVDYNDPSKYNYYKYMIEKLKLQNDLKMLLFFTDIDEETIPFGVQGLLMEKFNLFFEFVNKKDLQEISILGLKPKKNDDLSLSKLMDQHRYAQLIFERVMSYLSVISNEIIFFPYLDKLHRELDQVDPQKVNDTLNKILISYKERANVKNFTTYANEVLLKDICKYSYLSRHSIYYERTLVADKVESLFKSYAKKIPLVVEICAPNSLTTCSIIEKCKKILLFTASHSAYSLMTELHQKTEQRFLPPNVTLHLCHLNPEYMMHQYPEDLNGKVDFLVIGYGAGSQISNLTRFVRYAYNWLSENGTLFISLYNKDAIILNRNHINDQRFESSPLYLSDYWTYTLNDHPPLLKKLKAYSPESLRSTYLASFGTENINISTYPYISALINPSEYSREILDEIREADKAFASSGIHGQLINAIVYKNKLVKKTDSTIRSYLNDHNIQYENYIHTLAPDSKSLKRSLQGKIRSMSNTSLLKMVALQKKNPKSENGNCWNYAILPHDKSVVYDHAKYELVPETLVLKNFNQGTLSPLTVFEQRANGCNSGEKIFLLYKDRINTEYVIMSSGYNTESIQIRTTDFLKLASKADVIFDNIIE